MKILLSAYACEPNKGSEQGVGWSWAVELSKIHDVWVITRDNNEPTISKYLEDNPEYNVSSLHFIYVGVSRKIAFWEKGNRGIRLYNILWQKNALKVAKQYHSKIKFDLIQHVTFVSYTQSTYMYKLGIPMIWGPVSGGENIPGHIEINMSKKEKLLEIVRKLSQHICLYFPSIRKTMEKSRYIFVATEETKERIPSQYHNKTIIMPAIGLEERKTNNSTRDKEEKIKIIMAGRLIYWKAFDIGIKAFLKITDKYPNAELHILGEGNRKKELQTLAGHKLNDKIFFEDPVPHDLIYDFYSGYDIFLNTTLRDSGCMAMMEAMSVGLPCIAIATGGPKVLLGNSRFAINPNGYDYCINEIAEKLSEMITDTQLREEEGEHQKRIAVDRFTMKKKVTTILQYYK